MNERDPNTWSARTRLAAWIGISLTLVGIASLLAVRASLIGRRHVSGADLGELIAAPDDFRIGEGRFSGFRYASPRSAARGGDVQIRLSADARLALARLEKTIGGSRSADALHGIGVALAVEGRLDESINTLNEATSLQLGDASTWTDLAAAYLARSRPDDLSGASDAARRALVLTPSNDAAMFNRALALERLHLDREAIVEWQRLVRADSASGWSAEAKAHVVRLGEVADKHDWKRDEIVLREALHARDSATLTRTVVRFPQQTREFIVDTLLPEWAMRPHPSTEDLAVSLQGNLDLSRAVAEHGDRLMLDAVESILRGRRTDVEPLAEGHLAFARGRAASGQYRYTEADALLADAERRFSGRSPMVHWATMLRAIVLYQRNDLIRSRASLLNVRATVADRNYPSLLGQIDWTLGVISAGQGDFTGAFDRYRAALAAFNKIGEVENAATVQSLLAETTRLLGDQKASWSLEIGALSHLSEITRPQRKQTIVMMAGLAALRQGHPSAALDFQNRFFEAAAETGSPTAIAEALLHRARVHRVLKDSIHAREDLDAGRAALVAADPGVAAYLKAQIELEDGQNLSGEGSQRALQQLSDALAYFQASARIAWLPRVYLARARLLMRRGESASAARDLVAGIETLEAQRKSVSSEALRMSYLDETWDLFDAMIGLQLDLGSPREAFGFAERGRARSLLDTLGDVEDAALDPPRVAEAMPVGAVMLYFASTRSRAVVWVLGRGVERCVTLEVSVETMERHAHAYRRESEARHEAAVTELAVQLYGELIQPVESWLPRDATLVIVPDGALNQIPFAALRKTASASYLIQQHAIVLAPSARLFLRRARSQSSGHRARTALVIGNPSTDASVDLPSLPGAEEEAIDIAMLYPGSVRLVRGEATRRRFMETAPMSAVVHVAAHALPNEEFPDLSRLFLAPDIGTTGVVTANDLANMSFPETRVVVLAACGTLAGATFRGEGVTSLARPFLAKGVPQVVGTLWQIDDQTSRRLFTAFHRGYAKGLPAARALQQAQIEVILDRTAPTGNWAATVLLGSAESVAPSARPDSVRKP
jgi:CHAT domain-containing protein